MGLLSTDFLSKYVGQTPKNAGPLFYPVYLRTYSRLIPDGDKVRREDWWETVKRVVEYSMSLYSGVASQEELTQEAQTLYDNIFNLKVLPAGRTLWVGGTESARKFSESQFNCSFIVIDELEAFTDLFHMLLCGCGVGFRVLKEDVAKLPRLRPGIPVKHDNYNPVPANARLEITVGGLLYAYDNETYKIVIGDSKEAWVESLKHYFAALQNPSVEQIEINYDNIRPQGELIKTFGGRAAGPDGLREMFKYLEKIVNKSEGRFTTVDCVDICNIIALNVVVGGNRRSSEIALGSSDDIQFREAKKGLWTDPSKVEVKKWRGMSNNSVVFTSKPSRAELDEIFEGILDNGEPGFFNLEASQKRRPFVNGINPCAEILLDNRGVCNLSTVVFTSFVDDDGKLDIKGLKDAIKLATRIGLRQTNVNLSLPKWDAVQKRDRLTGVSMTGIMDALDKMGWEFDSLDSQYLFSCLNAVANVEADTYAEEMGIPRPLLVTAIKPEGTISTLPTVSSGMHRSYAPFYIRRIRVSSIDPVCKALKKIGVPYEQCVQKKDRTVFSFPIKTGAKMAAKDEPTMKQLQRYLMLQECYTDHNTSCTIYISPEEAPEVIDAIEENWDKIIAIALLPKDAVETGKYPQMPMEQITEEEYNELIKQMPDLSQLPEVVNKYETGELFDLDESDCSSGVCPVR